MFAVDDPTGMFSLSSDSRQVTIWRDHGTRFERKNIMERRHFPSRGVM